MRANSVMVMVFFSKVPLETFETFSYLITAIFKENSIWETVEDFNISANFSWLNIMKQNIDKGDWKIYQLHKNTGLYFEVHCTRIRRWHITYYYMLPSIKISLTCSYLLLQPWYSWKTWPLIMEELINSIKNVITSLLRLIWHV